VVPKHAVRVYIIVFGQRLVDEHCVLISQLKNNSLNIHSRHKMVCVTLFKFKIVSSATAADTPVEVSERPQRLREIGDEQQQSDMNRRRVVDRHPNRMSRDERLEEDRRMMRREEMDAQEHAKRPRREPCMCTYFIMFVMFPIVAVAIVQTLDDLFRKTKVLPALYWLPLNEEQVCVV
jgi:hypothetical protein